MNWEKLLGAALYSKAKEYAKANKLTMLGLVRLALTEILKKER